MHSLPGWSVFWDYENVILSVKNDTRRPEQQCFERLVIFVDGLSYDYLTITATPSGMAALVMSSFPRRALAIFRAWGMEWVSEPMGAFRALRISSAVSASGTYSSMEEVRTAVRSPD
jgi:hypothetical protein